MYWCKYLIKINMLSKSLNFKRKTRRKSKKSPRVLLENLSHRDLVIECMGLKRDNFRHKYLSRLSLIVSALTLTSFYLYENFSSSKPLREHSQLYQDAKIVPQSALESTLRSEIREKDRLLEIYYSTEPAYNQDFRYKLTTNIDDPDYVWNVLATKLGRIYKQASPLSICGNDTEERINQTYAVIFAAELQEPLPANIEKKIKTYLVRTSGQLRGEGCITLSADLNNSIVHEFTISE